MTQIKIRPRFRIDTGQPPEEIIERLRSQLERPQAPCTGTIVNDYVILRIPEKDSHFWSPRLTVDIAREGTHTRVRGLYGPNPVVWMMFAGVYLFAIFLGFVGLMWGGAQWSLGMEPQALWLVGISIVALLSSYGIALVGQKLSAEQMHVLREFLMEALREEQREIRQSG